MGQKNLKVRIQELEKEELRLFSIYNRRAKAEVKIGVLENLVKIISRIDELKQIV